MLRRSPPGTVTQATSISSIARCIDRSPAVNWVRNNSTDEADHTAHNGSARSVKAIAASCEPRASINARHRRRPDVGQVAGQYDSRRTM